MSTPTLTDVDVEVTVTDRPDRAARERDAARTPHAAAHVAAAAASPTR